MEIRRAQSPPTSRQRYTPQPSPAILLDELIVEILSCLPVKSLLRFRCVCKSWKSLISDSKSVKLHLQRSPKNTSLLLFWEQFSNDYEEKRSPKNANLLLFWEHNSNDYEETDLSIVTCSVRSLLENPASTIADGDCYRAKDSNEFWVVGSCNGLFCLVRRIFVNRSPEYWFCLWNPATKLRSQKLPFCHLDLPYSHIGFITFGFGYDHLNDAYKVVAVLVLKEDSQKTRVKIYSTGDNCWRNIHSFAVVPFTAPPYYPEYNDGVHLSGTLNWLALRNISSDDYKWNNTITIDQLVIVSLDLGKETYSQLLPPHCLDEAPHVVPTIGVLMDCLCFSHDSKRTHLVVWQMKEFGVEKSWTQFLKVSYQDLQIDCLQYDFPLLPLCMSENGDVLIMARGRELQAILYNRRDDRVERTELPKYISWNDAKDYVESLVSPCCN